MNPKIKTIIYTIILWTLSLSCILFLLVGAFLLTIGLISVPVSVIFLIGMASIILVPFFLTTEIPFFQSKRIKEYKNQNQNIDIEQNATREHHA